MPLLPSCSPACLCHFCYLSPLKHALRKPPSATSFHGATWDFPRGAKQKLQDLDREMAHGCGIKASFHQSGKLLANGLSVDIRNEHCTRTILFFGGLAAGNRGEGRRHLSPCTLQRTQILYSTDSSRGGLLGYRKVEVYFSSSQIAGLLYADKKGCWKPSTA